MRRPIDGPSTSGLLQQPLLSQSWSDTEASARKSLAPIATWQLRTEPFRALVKFFEIPVDFSRAPPILAT